MPDVELTSVLKLVNQFLNKIRQSYCRKWQDVRCYFV